MSVEIPWIFPTVDKLSTAKKKISELLDRFVHHLLPGTFLRPYLKALSVIIK
jgi:hypothetical protein